MIDAIVSDTTIVQRTVADLVNGCIFTFSDPKVAESAPINFVGAFGDSCLGYMAMDQRSGMTFYEMEGIKPDTPVWLFDVTIDATFKREK